MIHEHNIEERIFEYHEGLLDPAQKEELMAYLHEHPEWQRDFAIWAQSRLHPAAVESPAFQQGMLKKGAGAWAWGKSSFFAAAVVLVVAVWYFWPSSSKVEKANTQVIVNVDTAQGTKGIGTLTAMEDSATVAMVTSPSEEKRTWRNSQGEKPVKMIDSVQIQVEPLVIPLPDHTPAAVSPDTTKPEAPPLFQEQPEKLEAKKPTKQLLAAKDSVSSKQNESEAPSKKEKKKKIKHKFSLKPTSDIVPTNSNF